MLRVTRADYGSEYPFRGRRLDLGGHALHYLEEGAGETVLMVHGNPTWSFYFRNLVKALADERGFLEKGDKVGFLGIGSGLNCMMLGWEW